MKDTFEFILKENPSEELFEMLSDVNVETTPSFTIQDTHGNIAEYVKAIRCKDCLMHGVCRFEQALGLDGYCSQAERRTDDKTD